MKVACLDVRVKDAAFLVLGQRKLALRVQVTLALFGELVADLAVGSIDCRFTLERAVSLP